MRAVCAFVIATVLWMAALPVFAGNIDWTKVDQALGKPGSDQPDGVRRYGLPRTDLHVTVDGITVAPPLALGGWLAFMSMGEKAMMMGDLVLTENEVGAVMTKLLETGIAVTALHNHLLRAEPAPIYMHVAGQGDPVQLANKVRGALQESATPFGSAQPASAGVPEFDLMSLDRILGYKGKANGRVYQFAIPRGETITEGGEPIPPAMGTASSINFEPLSERRAAIAGDLVLLPEEEPQVLRLLREHHIEITAVHNHMLTEQPRIVFVHFWSVNDAETLARGLRAALGAMHLAKTG